MTSSHLPDGYHTVTPSLTVRNAAGAGEFSAEALRAEGCLRLTAPDGTIAHAEFRIGDSRIMIGEEDPDWSKDSPAAVAARAVRAGATVLIPVADQFYGDRWGRLQDPFGHVWIVATRKQEVPPTVMPRRFNDVIARAAEPTDG